MNSTTHEGEPDPSPGSFLDNRWAQLLAGIVAMIAVANLQYGWTLFVNPIDDKYGWGTTAIQFAFTLFVLTETWLVPVEAYLADRLGPRWLVMAGGILVGVAWWVNSLADSLGLLYLGAILGGIGAGIVYGISIGNALKWFPDRRGLAAGLTSAAFGAGSALTVLPIQRLIENRGYEAAFLWFGLGQGVVVLLAACVIRVPQALRRSMEATKDDKASPPPSHTQTSTPTVDMTPGQMLRTPTFWLLYLMFTMVATGGLMAVAQLKPMSKDYGVEKVPVTLMWLTLPALTFALSLDRVLNGLTRPFFGWVSDHIGRERTMFIAFSLEGVAIWLLINLAHDPVWFVLLSGLTFFAWGEIYSLFPAISGDLFGRKYATTNYGLLYTAKGTASLLVPLGSYLREVTGSWKPIFGVAIAFDWITALLALLVLPRLRARKPS